MHACVSSTLTAARKEIVTCLMCSLQMKEGRWVPGRAVQYYDVAGYLVGRWAGAFTLLITVISLFSTSVSSALPQSSGSKQTLHAELQGQGASVSAMTIAWPRDRSEQFAGYCGHPHVGWPWRSVSCS